MFGSGNQSTDEDPKPKLIVRIGFCTAKSDIPLTLCVLSIACTHFQIDETFYPEYPSGLIWIQTVFANGERERERKGERLVQARQSKHCIGGSTSRERDVFVLFEFRQFVFFYSGNSSTYFKVLCRSLQKKKKI